MYELAWIIPSRISSSLSLWLCFLLVRYLDFLAFTDVLWNSCGIILWIISISFCFHSLTDSIQEHLSYTFISFSLNIFISLLSNSIANGTRAEEWKKKSINKNPWYQWFFRLSNGHTERYTIMLSVAIIVSCYFFFKKSLSDSELNISKLSVSWRGTSD